MNEAIIELSVNAAARREADHPRSPVAAIAKPLTLESGSILAPLRSRKAR